MLHRMTKQIYDTLRETTDFKVFTNETEKTSDVWLQTNVKNGGTYTIRFISRDDDSDVAVRILGLVSVETHRRLNVLPVLNQINARFRFFKFTMDDDGDINVEYDFFESTPDPAACAKELVIRMAQIVDEAYPMLMRAMWS